MSSQDGANNIEMITTQHLSQKHLNTDGLPNTSLKENAFSSKIDDDNDSSIEDKEIAEVIDPNPKMTPITSNIVIKETDTSSPTSITSVPVNIADVQSNKRYDNDIS